MLLLMINFYHLLATHLDTEPTRMLVGNKLDLGNIRAATVEKLSMNRLGLTNDGGDDSRQNKSNTYDVLNFQPISHFFWAAQNETVEW